MCGCADVYLRSWKLGKEQMSSCGRGWGKGLCSFALRDWSHCQRHRVGKRKGAEVRSFLVLSFAVALALCFASLSLSPFAPLLEVSPFPCPWPSLPAEERVLPAVVLQPSTKPSPSPLTQALQWSPALEPGAPFSRTSHGPWV